ncbi:MAG: TatD family hydrolase [Gemmatimonadetes bacterium]|nr:TatD family hydrolase [Gemmatimonadota bacterium]
MSVPVLFDSHLHLTAERFDEDRQAVLRRARDAGVREMVTIASTPEDAEAAVALARSEPGLWATAGLHPHEAGRTSRAVLERIETLAAEPEVVAIGETGLDYHYDNAPRDLQIENFRAHLELASELSLPIVVHSRSAEKDTKRLVTEYGGRVRGVLHCFASGEELLAAALDVGWFVSFSGLVTFVDELEEAARRVPDEQILIETDAPYLSPAPKRGRRNEPAHLAHTNERLADVRGQEPSATASLTRSNAHRFYGLGEPDP